MIDTYEDDDEDDGDDNDNADLKLVFPLRTRLPVCEDDFYMYNNHMYTSNH